jgi:manganese/iron transport system permease protein
MLAVAMIAAVGSSVLGTLISFQINAATGPCIVLIQTGLFLLALFFAPGTGLLRRRTAEAVAPAKPLLGKLGG